MDITEISISKDQHLADVYPLIESNIILNKKLSGVGATHCEIIAPRNSIIVVPNVPIITCKVTKHSTSDNLFGVMQNVSIREIEDYIESTLYENRHIKIMVTPESFYKVRQAFNEVEVNMYETCFLMLDECHKFIKEVDFRPDIIQPFNSFFKFKNKALVSATPIEPSDPRFKEQNFRLVKVEPDYIYKFKIGVVPTDDIRRAFIDDFSYVRNGRTPSVKQCVFVNSANIIADFINQSKLHDISSIFCSDKSAVKLKQMGFKNVHTEWKEEYQNHFMFFTSRFYTGLDIWLDEKPCVLYFSDAVSADNTLMDPNTDMAQACGRFRRGMEQIIHYVAFNPTINTKSLEEIENEIQDIEKSYNELQQIYDNADSSIVKTAIETAIKQLPFNELFTTGNFNYFLKDNMASYETLKQYYININTLLKAYADSEYYSMAWEEEPHLYHDVKNNLPKLNQLSAKDFKYRQRKAIVETLVQIAPYYGTSEISDIIYTLKDYDAIIVDAFFKLGVDFITQCDYSIKRIKEALQDRTTSQMGYDEAFFHILYKTFEVGKKYLRTEAKAELRRIYDKFNLTPPSTITAKSLEWHFEIDDKARIGNQKAIKIVRRKVEGVTKFYKDIKDNTTTQPSTEFSD